MKCATSFPVTFRQFPVWKEVEGARLGELSATVKQIVKLRAERSGTGKGRIYTITVTATDSAGNAARTTVTVTVPMNQKKK